MSERFTTAQAAGAGQQTQPPRYHGGPRLGTGTPYPLFAWEYAEYFAERFRQGAFRGQTQPEPQAAGEGAGDE